MTDPQTKLLRNLRQVFHDQLATCAPEHTDFYRGAVHALDLALTFATPPSTTKTPITVQQVPVELIDPLPSGGSGLLRCTACDRWFKGPVGLAAHRRTQHDTPTAKAIASKRGRPRKAR